MRFLIKFSYDGTNYSGYQKQPGLNTIEGKLEEALTKINNGVKTTITSTGRTDKKVHANYFVFHFDSDKEKNTSKLMISMNKLLPEDIYVKGVNVAVPTTANAANTNVFINLFILNSYIW